MISPTPKISPDPTFSDPLCHPTSKPKTRTYRLFHSLVLPFYAILCLIKKISFLIPKTKNQTVARKINRLVKNIFKFDKATLQGLLIAFGLTHSPRFLNRIETLLTSLEKYPFSDSEKESLSFWGLPPEKIVQNRKLLLDLLTTSYNYCLVAPFTKPQERISIDLSTFPTLSEKAEEVVRVIKENQLAKIGSLVFASCGLTCFPKEFCLFRELETLDISDNEIEVLPPEIAALTKLQRLVLSRNRLRTFPEEVLRLPHLHWLGLSFNHIDSLPPEIYKLSKLQTLYLIGNKLKTLPKQISGLTELTFLNVRLNRISTLPEGLCDLPLYSLNVSDNRISELPEDLFKLPLEELYVAGNAPDLISPNLKGTLDALIKHDL